MNIENILEKERDLVSKAVDKARKEIFDGLDTENGIKGDPYQLADDELDELICDLIIEYLKPNNKGDYL